MMIIETRQAAKDKAFDLLDEIKDLGRKKKMAICELEETLYDCFESSEEDEEYENSNDYIPGEEDQDMEYRNRRSYRRGMRSGMRHEDEEQTMARRAMRMRRRNRMGRFI